MRKPDSPAETEGLRQKKEKKRRRRLTGGRDRWETRAAASVIETRCRPVQYIKELREKESWSRKNSEKMT